MLIFFIFTPPFLKIREIFDQMADAAARRGVICPARAVRTGEIPGGVVVVAGYLEFHGNRRILRSRLPIQSGIRS